MMQRSGLTVLIVIAAFLSLAAAPAGAKPNILVIWGDGVGQGSISAYGHGVAGYRTPSIDRLASEGILFTDYYGGRTSTAGRSAYITGQSEFRTGLADAGAPGTSIGLNASDPTIAGLLREYGYATGHFGKHHVGDRDAHLPTNHGFDVFFGTLYDYGGVREAGKRGVIRAFANGRIVDTGAVNDARIATLDGETVAAAIDFMQRAYDDGKPFYIWWNDSGTQTAADAMLEHDRHVGRLLTKLDELGLADNTIVHYSTDRGAGISPYSTADAASEGGWRVPSIVRWPAAIEAGRVSNATMQHLDWMPTLLAVAGADDIKARLLKDGVRAGGRKYLVHLDGYDFTPLLTGESETGPRREVLYFGASGELVALRYDKRKGMFATGEDGLALRESPLVVDLRFDPYENREDTVGQAEFAAPAHGYIGQFLATFEAFPPRESRGMYGIGAVLEMLQPAEPTD